jgi:hypothetical protein
MNTLYQGPEAETTFGLNAIYLPMQFTDWLLVEVALLLIGLTRIF